MAKDWLVESILALYFRDAVSICIINGQVAHFLGEDCEVEAGGGVNLGCCVPIHWSILISPHTSPISAMAQILSSLTSLLWDPHAYTQPYMKALGYFMMGNCLKFAFSVYYLIPSE